MTTNMIHTPFDFAAPIKAGRRRFWKQILPVTEIDYDGKKVKFDPEFHKSLELSYQDQVYEQIPLVFADGANTHNEDPRNFGGEIVHMENRGKDGTWALIEADKDAAKIINKNPRLGVSARIAQAVEKGGKVYDHAIRHVLMTMFPRVQGMSPWQAVDLSDDADIEVVDLTAATYNKEGSVMGKTKTTSKGKGTIDLSRLSDEEFNNLLDLATTALADPEADEEEELDEDEDLVEEEQEPRRKIRRKKSKTKVTIEKDSEDEGDEEEDEEAEEEETDLSDADRASGSEALRLARQTRIDLAQQRWEHEREGYLSEGVPAFMLDLAEPVLRQPESMTIDLSDTETVNATDIIRKMLDGAKGVVDLTGEFGHQIDLSEVGQEDETQRFLDAWTEQYG